MQVGDYVEWGSNGLGIVAERPRKKHGEEYVKVEPLNTGDPTVGIGILLDWPVRRFRPADMSRWVYIPERNRYQRVYAGLVHLRSGGISSGPGANKLRGTNDGHHHLRREERH